MSSSIRIIHISFSSSPFCQFVILFCICRLVKLFNQFYFVIPCIFIYRVYYKKNLHGLEVIHTYFRIDTELKIKEQRNLADLIEINVPNYGRKIVCIPKTIVSIVFQIRKLKTNNWIITYPIFFVPQHLHLPQGVKSKLKKNKHKNIRFF